VIASAPLLAALSFKGTPFVDHRHSGDFLTLTGPDRGYAPRPRTDISRMSGGLQREPRALPRRYV